jgi:putative ABC transport system permease protein
METLLKDLRYGFRSLLKRPGFTAIVIITLALGIGASTAIFSVVNSVVLRRLPYAEADRIVAIQELSSNGKRIQVTAANFYDWRQQNTVFEHLAAIRMSSSNLTLADRAERIDISQTSANFFSVFGVQPEYGRLFLPEDEQAGHAPVVVLSDALWQRRFAGDKNVIGKSITLDGKPYTVVGIAPPTFVDPFKAELWLPPLRLVPELNEQMDVTQNRGMGYMSAVALLKRGVTLQQAASEMETITSRLRQQYPDSNNRRFNRVVSLQKDLVGDTSGTLWLLFGAVSFVLLIACANVANLLLANSSSRVKEMSIRTALGASRWRVMRQLFTESTMLALVGGGAGFLLSFWLLSSIKKLLPTDFPRINEIHMDWRVLAFTVFASILTGILFGFAPALQFARSDVQDAIRETGRGMIGSLRRNRFRQALIVAEVALSVVLLAGAGLLFRSFMRLQSVDAGFMAEQVLTARLTPSGPTFKDDSDYARFYKGVIEKLRTVPGVRDAAAINTLPLRRGPTAGFRIEGQPITTPDKWPICNLRKITPDYFLAMGIPIVQGRPFNDHDDAKAPLALVVNQALAQENFPGQSAVGKRVNFGNTDSNNQPVWFEIVGVAANSRSLELREEPIPELYFSTYQDPWPEMSLVVRSNIDADSLAGAVRQAVADVDRTVPVSDFETMDHIVSTSVTQPRFNLFLVAVFSVLALLLSAAGIYGVTSYSVSQRTHELGIRIALGAQVRHVLGMILKQGMGVIALGLVLGLGAAFVLLRLMKSLLFEVTETDPLTFVVTTVVLTFVALIACYVPARRATKVDPLEALRYE